MKTKKDSIYTPASLAASMVDSAGDLSMNPRAPVVDFAAGHGELLQAARNRWPEADFVATDIDRRAVKLLKLDGRWRVASCDFLNPRSRIRCSVLKELRSSAGLILLNPPFSCRGGTRVLASASDVGIPCSIGLAFVVNSVDYLAAGGVMVTVLPSGSLTSQKDKAGWDLVRALCEVRVMARNGHRAFHGAVVRTDIIRLVKRPKPERPFSSSERPIGAPVACGMTSVSLVRGNISMYEIQAAPKKEGVPLVHTTDLFEGTVYFNRWAANKNARVVGGPLVLIPRVGNPDRRKVIAYLGSDRFILSDCLMAIVCKTPPQASELWKCLTDNWNTIEPYYVGSGARYITVQNLASLLRHLGYSPVAIGGPIRCLGIGNAYC
jgi:hypothetical protein